MNNIKKSFILILLLSVCFFTSCESNEQVTIKQSLLIYMVDNNNLLSYAENNINDIMSSYLPKDLNDGSGDVLLLYTRVNNFFNSDDNIGDGPHLVRVYKDGDDVKYEILKEYEKSINSATKEQLKSVLDLAYNLYPGEENGLILWDHGTGWLPAVNSSKEAPKTYGFENNKSIDVQDLPEALGRKYYYIIFDACLMGGVEVEYELKDNADFIIASQTEIMGSGFPYNLVVKDLLFLNKANLHQVSEDYYNYYNDNNNQPYATISICKTFGLDHLAITVANILKNDRENISKIDISSIQSFSSSPGNLYYDLYDFMESISTNPNELTTFKKALDNVILDVKFTSKFQTIPINRDCGLSTFISRGDVSKYFKYYKKFKWDKDVKLIDDTFVMNNINPK
ncbi:MAG: clostripain-related cysteine peptidase [Bacteroidales bacterium]